MSRIKAGDLRQEIVLKRPVAAVNDRGRPVNGWESAATVMAGKADVSGREFYQAQAVHAEDTVTWTIRWRDDIDTTWRVSHHGVEYEILEVNHLGYLRDYLRLRTRRVTGQRAGS